jgi:hypothetical protein
MEEKEATIEIDEPIEAVEELVVDTTGLNDKEIAMGKEQGTIKEEKKDEHKELQKPETKEGAKEEEHKSFEEVEKDENHLKKYNKNEQALYWKWKTDKQKKQSAIKEKEEAVAEIELEKVRHLSTKQKLDKLRAELTAGKEITSDDLLKIIDDGKAEEKEAPKPKDNAEILKDKIRTKAEFAEKIGSAQYEHFQEYAKLAKEVMAEDVSGDYQKMIDEAFVNDNVDENMLVERIVRIAKLSDKFGTIGKSAAPGKQEEAEKIIKNAEKKPNSASIAKAGGKRVVTEDELTVAEASKLSTEQWGKLSQRTRTRILKGIDP